ncbi:MAG: MATE family efflux transporter [Clostridiales bacterium]|nr:MATE family efflux transporter [Clostridiales bacterium]
MVAEKKKVDFTVGKIFIKLLLFVLPIMATNLLQMFYNAADMMVVSLSSEANAVGAIGTTTSFVHFIVNVFIGFSVGANVVVAKHIGANDREKTQRAVHTSLIMALIFGFVGAGLGIAVSRPILKAMGNTGSLLSLAVTYTYIYFLGVPFLALTNYLIAIFRAKGDAKTPLIVLSVAGLINVLLNFFFVVVVGLSVEGVAIATSVANLLSFIVLLWKLRKDKDFTTFSLKRLKIERKSFGEIVRIGLPAAIQGGLFSLSNMLIQSSIVTVNNNLCPPNIDYQPVVNGSAAAGNIEGFVYTSMNAVYQGAITFTSQNMGAKKPERVKPIMYNSFLLTSIIGLTMALLVMLLKTPLLALYGVKAGAEGRLEALAMETANIRLWFICVPYFLCGLMEVCTGVLRGLGRSLTSTVIALVGSCLLRVIWLLTVFPAKQTLEMIFVCYPITWILTTLVAFIVIQLLLKKLRKEQE